MAGRKIGERASEYAKRREAMEDDLWLKGFKEGETKLRPWPMDTDDWTSYREHYDGAMRRYFPCCEEDDCEGCTSDSDRTRGRSRKWIMPALDKDGRLQYFKVGGRLYGMFQRREQRSPDKTVSDRDFIVVRTGSGFNDTEYDLEPAERYKVKFDEVDPQPVSEDELKTVLGQKYDDYVHDLRGEDDVEDQVEEVPAKKTTARKTAAKEEEGSSRITPAKKTAARATRASSNGDEEKDDDVDELPKDPTDEEFETAPTAVIKRWLSAREVPVPAKATRTAIITMAKEYVPF